MSCGKCTVCTCLKPRIGTKEEQLELELVFDSNVLEDLSKLDQELGLMEMEPEE